ncbi:uncharacterized protein LACBIDRAFT_294438 [Laccaria bicolor S238N-H82]|uniref:Predicted protein n=1 Tax=Laccaria bicolor (strain S238N-H82 / ATCC MYA-4686) TaxID=486041 RepID=B0DB36_LACBS|nr:uncharacterized protein LACBIDRAFT_294438 [Laccaria bicolor S238N-H82]EDR08133.1 predicted protein [Laccaria bicolor S238N-H82]|eukprot:XP_001881203.1 predicted protein [Laccaria bicolor S238N-H82]
MISSDVASRRVDNQRSKVLSGPSQIYPVNLIPISLSPTDAIVMPMLVLVLFNDKRRPHSWLKAIGGSLLAADSGSTGLHISSMVLLVSCKAAVASPTPHLRFSNSPCSRCFFSSLCITLDLSSRQESLSFAAPVIALDCLALSPWTFHLVKKISSRHCRLVNFAASLPAHQQRLFFASTSAICLLTVDVSYGGQTFLQSPKPSRHTTRSLQIAPNSARSLPFPYHDPGPT